MEYYVTTAVGGSQSYIDHTEMDKVQQYTDYINIMSYDYAGGWDAISGHHTNLYVSSGDSNQYSAHRSIQAFIAAGVPATKIVMEWLSMVKDGKWNQLTTLAYTEKQSGLHGAADLLI
jgi:chitinase